MKRHVIVAFAIVASVIVVSASPAAATSTNLTVASQHTSDTDFQNANTLDNITVEGAGDSASIKLSGGILDDFEDGDTDGWTNSNDIDAQTNVVWDGQYSAHFSPGTTDATQKSLGATYKGTINVTVAAQWEDAGNSSEQIELLGNGGSGPEFGTYQGDFIASEESTYTTLANAESGKWYVIKAVVDIENQRYNLYINGTQIGNNLQFGESDGATTIETFQISNIDGGEVYVDNIDVTHAARGQYISQTHSVSNAAEAAVNVTQLSDATATLTAEYYDGNEWQTGGQTTVTSAGNHTISLPSVSSSTWRVNATVEKTSSDPAFELADDSILFKNHAPAISNVTPADDTQLTTSPTFNATISDDEFGTAQGESVTVSLAVDGVTTNTTTLTSNDTVSFAPEIDTGGEHSFEWTLSDNYGATTTETGTVSVPGQLYIRNVSDPQGLINGTNVSATVTLYPKDGEKIQVQRDVSNGWVDLTGLPVDSFIVAEVSVDGYATRRTLITSIYDQQSIYLPPDNLETVTVSYELQDRTGRFPSSSSYLIIRRGLNTTGAGTDWEAVAGDGFDATGSFQTNLNSETRYQLIVLNSQGDRRVLGYYDPPAGSDTEPLPIGSVSIAPDVETDAWSAGASVKNVSGTTTVGLRYYDAAGATDGLTIRVINTTNEQELYSASYAGPITTHTESIALPGQPIDGRYRVEIEPDRGGTTTTEEVIVGGVEETDTPGVDENVLMLTGMGAIVLTGLVIVTKSAAAAVIAAAIVAQLLSLLGWVPIHPVQVGVAMTIGLLYHFATE